jgi:hypothetical protein
LTANIPDVELEAAVLQGLDVEPGDANIVRNSISNTHL